jgi:hypothetical protein
MHGEPEMSKSIQYLFNEIMNGTVSREEVEAAHARIVKTSREVNATFDAMDKRDRELTTEEIDAAYTMGNASIYADHDKGYTLD